MAPDSRTQASTGGAAPVDWRNWHASYERPTSPMAQRLALVENHVVRALSERPSGPISVISICAGQGHDLIGAARHHERRGDIRARLVELDEDNVKATRQSLLTEGLTAIEAVQGDASLTDAYDGAAPAQVILICGVLGNIATADVARTISLLPSLCAPGAHVVWTRNRNPPDLVPSVLEMFAAAGFDTLRLDDGPNLAIATSRLTGPPRDAAPAGTRLFSFIGQGALWAHLDEHTRNAMQAIFDTASTLPALVEAVRAIPLGGPAEQSVERMLREARGTPVSKHLFLADMLARRFPHTAPRAMFRIYALDARRAHAIYGEDVAAVLAGASIEDVHGYLTVDLDGRRIALDVSVPGPPAWDGRSALGPVCGPGDDRTVGDNPHAELCGLLEHLRATSRRAGFEHALASLSLS